MNPQSKDIEKMILYENKTRNNEYINIINDIRNFRKLNDSQLEYIRQLGEKEKMEIIFEFNKCNEVVSQILK